MNFRDVITGHYLHVIIINLFSRITMIYGVVKNTKK